MAKVHIKFQTAKETAKNDKSSLIISISMEIYERKSISMSCTSVNRSNKRLRWRISPPLTLYIEKVEGKGGCLRGKGSYL
jgi:hypothetical protein